MGLLEEFLVFVIFGDDLDGLIRRINQMEEVDVVLVDIFALGVNRVFDPIQGALPKFPVHEHHWEGVDFMGLD